MDKGFIIRRASRSDEYCIRKLFLEMMRTIYETDDVKGYGDGYLDRYWSGGDDSIFVADNGKVIAFLSAEVHKDPVYYLYIDDFSVRREYRRRGIGTELMKAAESHARDLGIPAILLHVEKKNEKALALYERLGYSGFRDDGNRILMKKDLK